MKTSALQFQFKLWTCLLVVIPALTSMAIYTAVQVRMVKQEKRELISQRVDFQKRLIEFWLAERHNQVRNISRLEMFRVLDEPRMRNTLAVMQANNREFDSLSFIDKDGTFRLSTLPGGIRFTTASGQPYYQAAAAGQEFISDIAIGRNSGLPIINVSAPVYDDPGNFQGLILGSVRTATIEKILRDNWPGQTGDIILVNREAILITEPRDSSGLAARGAIVAAAGGKFKLSPAALMNIRLGETGSGTWVDYAGNNVIGAYQFIPERNWTLIGSINEDEIIAPIYRQLEIMVAGTFWLVLLLLPLATLVTNRINRPIAWLIEQSNLIAREEYGQVERSINLAKMPYELARLCETVVKMSRKIEQTVGLLRENEAKLESKIGEIGHINNRLQQEVGERQAVQAELKKVNAGLEDRVRERTRQLQEANAALEEEIRERQAAQEILEKMSITDTLTGLNNHGYMVKFLEDRINEANRYGTPLAIGMFDLDYFKKVNDTYGHIEGDRVLQAVAECLTENVRESDVVGRYGGEEFILVLPNTGLVPAYELAERLRGLISELLIGGKNISVTVSGGLAEYKGEKLGDFIARADRNLYAAKIAGRNRIVSDEPVPPENNIT